MTMTFNATAEDLSKATIFVGTEIEKIIEKTGRVFTPADQMKIDIALEEIFINIVHYAYKDAGDDAEKYAKVSVENENQDILITFADHGFQYNPLAKEDPDITLSAEERQIGGLGIFMVKKTMKDMKYQFKDGENQLTLVY